MGRRGLRAPLTPHSIVSGVPPPCHGRLDARTVALARRWPPGGAPARSRRSPSHPGRCSPHGTTPVARTPPRHGLPLTHASLSLDPRQPCWCFVTFSRRSLRPCHSTEQPMSPRPPRPARLHLQNLTSRIFPSHSFLLQFSWCGSQLTVSTHICFKTSLGAPLCRIPVSTRHCLAHPAARAAANTPVRPHHLFHSSRCRCAQSVCVWLASTRRLCPFIV